jgi:nitrogen regulatory protein PII
MAVGSCVFVIVNRGNANQLLQVVQHLGALRGTIFLGEGTVPSRWANWLGISKTEKEVLLIAVPDELRNNLYSLLRQRFQMHKRYKGIVFSVPYRAFHPETGTYRPFNRYEDAPYVCLMTVVEKGLGQECMAHARAAGAQGGTIIHAHGAGVPQDFYFPLVIEPQKEIVLIVTKRENATAIRDNIYTQMQLERKGSGILFALPVTQTLGLYEEWQQERRAT